MPQTILRTLIVDDEPLAIERLQILAGQQEGIALVGTAGDGASALRMVEALAPDLVLCDIAMPIMVGGRHWGNVRIGAPAEALLER